MQPLTAGQIAVGKIADDFLSQGTNLSIWKAFHVKCRVDSGGSQLVMVSSSVENRPLVVLIVPKLAAPSR